MSNELTVIDQREVTFYGDDLIAVKVTGNKGKAGAISMRSDSYLIGGFLRDQIDEMLSALAGKD